MNRNIIEDEEDIDMKVLEKAYRVLRRGYQREFTKENEVVDSFLGDLEKNSFYLSASVKNTHEDLLLHSEEE